MIRADSVPPLPDEHEDLVPVDPDAEFWSQSDELKHVHSYARNRRASPPAVLAGVLRRATAATEPYVQLPAIVGGETSVNLFTVSAGASGEGKGAADAAASAAVFFHDMKGETLDAPRPSIGSGEGLARLFSGGKGQDPLTRAHVSVPEVKTLEGLMSRQGATLEAELLKGYMGEALGFQNAQKDTTTAVAPQSYRLCLGVGCQPENAGFFLLREKDGFPQRFFWTAVHDAHAPAERPPPVDPLPVLVPSFPVDDTGRHVLVVPDSVKREIDEFRHRVLTRDPGVDPLDGHLKLTQLKLTFALAVLHGRSDLREDHWKIAGDLIDMSVTVRSGMRQAVEDARRRANNAKGKDQGERAQIVAQRMEDHARRRVGEAIVRKLKSAGSATRRDLRVNCTQAIRGEFDGVFDLFLEKGLVVECPADGNDFSPKFALGPDVEGGVS